MVNVIDDIWYQIPTDGVDAEEFEEEYGIDPEENEEILKHCRNLLGVSEDTEVYLSDEDTLDEASGGEIGELFHDESSVTGEDEDDYGNYYVKVGPSLVVISRDSYVTYVSDKKLPLSYFQEYSINDDDDDDNDDDD